MGLDVYLYRYDNFDDTRDRERAADKAINALYETDLTDEARDVERARIGETYGTDAWGSDKTGKEKIERDSALHPDHMYKVGYFSSSYNDGGIERIARSLRVPSLADILNPDDVYEVRPDWAACKERAEQAVALWREAAARSGNRKVMCIDANIFGVASELPQSPDDALSRFLAFADQPHGRGWFTNRDGHYFLNDDSGNPNPLKVLGAFPGMTSILGRRPCTYLIYEVDDAYGWYLQAMDVVAETCAWVLTQPDPSQFVLHWSS